LNGSIPPELANLSNLTFLNLEANQLSGSIPRELGTLSNLTFLNLAYNELNGSIPPELGTLSHLTRLSLGDNELSGNIPPELANLSSLTGLSLGDNELSGSIPPELANLSNLTGIGLGGNQLSGSIPPELANLSNLTGIGLGGNQLSGSIPPELANLSNLSSLNLSDNQLSGSIPPELANLSNLGYLYLDNNELSGAIPRELANLTSIYSAPLSNNYLDIDVTDQALLDWLNAHSTDWQNQREPEFGSDGTIYLPCLFVPEVDIPVASVLTPFDANVDDVIGPSNWLGNYGKSPEIIVESDGVELDVLAQDYNPETPWEAVLLHIKPTSTGYNITQARTDIPFLDRVMGLDSDESGNRYYATGVDESDVVDSTYPPLNTYRNNIVRVIKLNRAGDVEFNIDLDTARHAHDNDAEMIINPMTASTSRLAVGGNEIALVHGINTNPDNGGARHQKALSTRLHATSGAILQTYSAWVSHSFDQRLFFDGEEIIEYHLGDAFPRHIVFARKNTSYPLFYIKGALGENNTYTRLGGIARIEGDPDYTHIALFATENTADTGSLINGARNLAIVRITGDDHSVDPGLPDTLTVSSAGTQYVNRLRWLTQYSSASNIHAERPKIISIGGNQYIVLWEEWRNTDEYTDTFQGVYGMVIDDKGNILRAATLITDQHHLHRGDDAFFLDNRAAWITGNAVGQELYIHFVDAELTYEMVTVD
jgi:hypothetical protein